MVTSGAEFIMEVTDKTKADVKVRRRHSFLRYGLILTRRIGWNVDRLRRQHSTAGNRSSAIRACRRFQVCPQVQDLQHEQLVDQPQGFASDSFFSCAIALTVVTDIALKRIMESDGMELEIIVNPKVTDDGQQVIQVIHTAFISF